MSIKAVIFDLDGTLLDTIADIANSMNEALLQLGLKSFTVEDYKIFVGRGVDNLVTSVLEEQSADKSLFSSVKHLYLANYLVKQNELTKPYSGIVTLLEVLKERKILVSVLSNKPDPDTKSVIQYYFGDYPFFEVMGKREGYEVKPHPASVNEIIRASGFLHSEILYVGDTRTDMETAVNAHLIPVGVLWGFRKKDELLQSGAEYIISHPSELIDIIEKRE